LQPKNGTVGTRQKNYYLTEQQKLKLKMEGVTLSSVEKLFRVIITVAKSDDIPVVVPKILYKALDFLCNSNNRKKAEINSKNEFIFPSSLNSVNPSDGPDNLTQFMKLCGVEEGKISSVKARKLIANDFASYDFPDEIRDEIFRFLGHSKNINRIHYCAPDVAKVLSKIAPVLQDINDKYDKINFDWEIKIGKNLPKSAGIIPRKKPSFECTYVF